jgi:hypothetical protein
MTNKHPPTNRELAKQILYGVAPIFLLGGALDLGLRLASVSLKETSHDPPATNHR